MNNQVKHVISIALLFSYLLAPLHVNFLIAQVINRSGRQMILRLSNSQVAKLKDLVTFLSKT